MDDAFGVTQIIADIVMLAICFVVAAKAAVSLQSQVGSDRVRWDEVKHDNTLTLTLTVHCYAPSNQYLWNLSPFRFVPTLLLLRFS